MRVMLTFKLPHDPFNAYVKDGSIGSRLTRVVEASKPQAAYFTDHTGTRSAVLIVDLPTAASIPALCEPWFLVFKAEIEVKVVMTADDLKQSGLEEIGKKWA